MGEEERNGRERGGEGRRREGRKVGRDGKGEAGKVRRKTGADTCTVEPL